LDLDRLYLYDDIVLYLFRYEWVWAFCAAHLLVDILLAGMGGVLLGVMASLLARRGAETGLRRADAGGKAVAAGVRGDAGGAACWPIVGSGSWYYYNTHVLNPFLTDKDDRKMQAEYEKLYKKYERAPIPKITAVDTAVNIYPEKRSFNATGTYTAVNESDKPIQDIYVTNGRKSLKEVSFDRRLRQQRLPIHKLGFWIYHLATPLAPGESLQIRFQCGYENPGFRNAASRRSLLTTERSSIAITSHRWATTRDANQQPGAAPRRGSGAAGGVAGSRRCVMG
jgi:ABC-2 type transport system permease protein